MTPWKPLPIDVPVTSTNWPTTKWSAVSLGADLDQVLRADAELGDLALRLDRGGGEVAAQRLRRVLDLAQADAELQRGVAVLLDGALRDHLAVVELEHGDRHLLARVGEDAGHADLLCDHT